ncbi:hypothetical protein [Leptospira mayottensis]|uniref:Uncharacterized protein n=2 Tax=Leptospira mayottensis TaxID=1137606 RepID=A0AA87MLV4_9LEPT|nr:hypothetical protein [Leptospira mayottensis]AXR66653.1 hypothetical protein DQM28_20470 [Leptospira mayottensis]AZQ04273.1 hypothetical protein LEP1GSC190_19385 [Leptospira mayottensis 200901116]EKR98105.1 hypothetical protein LEP1GSC125_1572 [Leptospira mayottensis 200901122]TGN04304.1 hypothetical protein EHR03_10695 [Leptospira mayottensis]
MANTTLRPVSCDKCLEFKGLVARVFISEEHLNDPQYMQSLGLKFLGGDKFSGDPITNIAVWLGKNNANLKFKDYQFCCPLHPNCSHEYETFTFKETDEDDEVSEIFRQGKIRDAKERLRTDEIFKQNMEANRERIRLEKKYGPITKSDVIYRVGTWEEPTCAMEPERSWLSNYIAWKLKTI